MSSKTFAITLDGVEYRVTARELTDISTVITGITPDTAEYTGSEITVTPVSEATLTENIDYTIAYSDNISVGDCMVTINGIGDYEGTCVYTLTITGEEPENTESDDLTEENPEDSSDEEE